MNVKRRRTATRQGHRLGSDDSRSQPPADVIWLNYEEAARRCRWSVAYLRNLVSAGRVPVYGPPRKRRFRADMLDLYLQDPAASMRKFQKEK